MMTDLVGQKISFEKVDKRLALKKFKSGTVWTENKDVNS